jgi:putative membrane protein
MSEIESYRGRDAKQALAKKLTVAVWVISAAVLFLVGLMRQVKFNLPEGMSLDFLPPLHALLNSGAAVALSMAIFSIKGGKVQSHLRWIYVAMSCSLLFLLCYVAYHFTTAETIYGDLDGDGALNDAEREEAGGMRLLYLCILLSHIALAAISLPFILLTFVYGFTNQFERHRTMAKKVFPVWLYVAITGPIVYLLLKPYY